MISVCLGVVAPALPGHTMTSAYNRNGVSWACVCCLCQQLNLPMFLYSNALVKSNNSTSLVPWSTSELFAVVDVAVCTIHPRPSRCVSARQYPPNLNTAWVTAPTPAPPPSTQTRRTHQQDSHSMHYQAGCQLCMPAKLNHALHMHPLSKPTHVLHKQARMTGPLGPQCIWVVHGQQHPKLSNA